MLDKQVFLMVILHKLKLVKTLPVLCMILDTSSVGGVSTNYGKGVIHKLRHPVIPSVHLIALEMFIAMEKKERIWIEKVLICLYNRGKFQLVQEVWTEN